MTDILQTINDQLEGIPFFQEIMDEWNEYAEEHYQTRDPYFENKPNGLSRRLKLPNNATKIETKAWKRVQKRAWMDDRCFLGCYPIDCGIGLAPIVVLLPVIGPILMYAVHARLIHQAAKTFTIDTKTLTKLEANIFLDLLITLPPLIGTFFGWLNACSTRNAAMIHTMITHQLIQRAKTELELAQQSSSHSYGYNRTSSKTIANDKNTNTNTNTSTNTNTNINNQKSIPKSVHLHSSDGEIIRNETAIVGNNRFGNNPNSYNQNRGYPNVSNKTYRGNTVQQQGVYRNIV